MKRKFKSVGLLFLVITLLFACTNGESNVEEAASDSSDTGIKQVLVGDIPCEFPLVTEDTTLNILQVPYDVNQAESIFVWDKYEEMTGVHINWKNVTKAEAAEEVHIALTNMQQLDLIMRCKIAAELLTQYGENGLIIDLAKDDLLKNNAPNCYAYLQAHQDSLASIMNPDGSIYCLPQVNSGAELRVCRKLFINKNWLENLDLEVPTTTEEVYQLLKAFKEQDANGNGDPNDEIPLCSRDWIGITEAFFGAFGLGNRGVHNQIFDYNEETGGVRFVPASDEYREFIQYFNTLYDEELMDPHTFTMTADEWTVKASEDRIGMFAFTNLASVPAEKIDNWIAIEEALEGPFGDKQWAAIRANFHSVGAAVIPSTCKDPALVLQWLDYFWTDEGTLFYHMGIENETFTVLEDGTYDYVSSIYDEIENENKSFDQVIAQYSPYPGGGNPTVEIAPYFMGGEMAPIPAEAARKLFEYGPEEYWPSFTFSSEESARFSTLQSDIKKYYRAMETDYIIGAKSLDMWEEYKAQLNELGLPELLSFYDAAVNRYYQQLEAAENEGTE